MKKQPDQPKKSSVGKWILILVVSFFAVIFALTIAAIIIAVFTGGDMPGLGNTALIPIKGTIVSEESGGLFSGQEAASSVIIKQIEKADKDPQIKAIIFEINSPGGEVVASDEISAAIKKVNKTTVAWVRDMDASGGYWIASAADHIVAHRLSITGSVGVTGSYVEFAGLLNHFNMTYRQLMAGKYKEVGNPYEEMSSEDRRFLMKIIDAIHKDFLESVAQNRNLTQQEVENISTGAFYLGKDALSLHLVDELGGKEEALKYVESKINATPKLVVYENKRSFFDMFSAKISEGFYSMGRRFREGLVSQDARVRT